MKGMGVKMFERKDVLQLFGYDSILDLTDDLFFPISTKDRDYARTAMCFPKADMDRAKELIKLNYGMEMSQATVLRTMLRLFILVEEEHYARRKAKQE